MTPEMQKYIELLESQLGYAEKAGAYTKFGAWYGKNVEFDADYSSAPWCDMYLSWAAHKLGYEDWIGQFAWTVSHAEWFKEQGAWGHKPKPGAFVFYDWSGSNSIDKIDHVGIVTRVEGDTIFTIEGNIDGGVAKRKERDTSKVVGYGYPERIKSRLDEEAARQQREAQKKANDQAALQPGPGTDVGALQPSGTELLTSLIPRSEIEEPAQAPETGSSPAKKEPQAAPTAPKDTTGPVTGSVTGPVLGTVAPESPKQQKKAKHAKPATADTTAATAEPLPTHAGASATGPMPAISSPTLVGSALVAALALLAVAKTRRLRTAPATAGATAPRPAVNRRRRRRRLEVEVEPVRTSRRTAALQPAATLDTLTATAALDAAALEAFQPAASRDTAALDTAALASAALDALQPATALDALQPATALDAARPAARAGGRRRRPLDTRPFDLATDAPRRAAVGRLLDEHADLHRHLAGIDPFDAFCASRPTEPARSGPVEILLDTGPLERFVDTGPFERIVIPQATSAFDAFSRTAGRGGDTPGISDTPDIGATYQGRRRRLGRPADESGTADLPLRGRRHRRPAPTQGVHIGGAQPFAQDAPLAGRRHASAGSPQPHRREDERQLVGSGGTGRAASGHPARSAPSQPGRNAPAQPGRSTPGQPRRRGRHRA
ncbi:CHAP domain-containing protein [Nonomuraea angiospora]|uniref:CHAP domain-containing protein n=2 Tax=Nonomuraea angiospora TaxID=46172 RepID=UPI003794A9BC